MGGKTAKGTGKKKSAHPSDQIGPWFKENIEAVIIAFVMALVIRCFCIEVFKIPSSSMEPYLLGDVGPDHDRCAFKSYHGGRTSGDRIMVTKYYYDLRDVQRFDVAVFRFPLNQSRNFIKRIVGLPREDFFLHQGNVYFRKWDGGGEEFLIARKPSRTQEAIWIDVTEHPDLLAGPSHPENFWRASAPGLVSKPAGFEIVNGRLSTYEKDGSRSILLTFKPPIMDDRSNVGEIRIKGRMEVTGPKGRFFLSVRNEFGHFEVVLSPSEACMLTFNGFDGRLPIYLRTDRIRPEQWYEFDLQIYDGLVRFYLDGRLEADHPFLNHYQEIDVRPKAATVALGSQDFLFSLENLSIGRDIFYRERGAGYIEMSPENPLPIDDDYHVMMGDNVANSHDSRAWKQLTYRLKDGRTIVCESQEVVSTYEEKQEYMKILGLEEEPYRIIKADEHGNIRWFNEDDLEDDDRKNHPFIHRRFIIGRAFWIWWPPGRWFRLIR